MVGARRASATRKVMGAVPESQIPLYIYNSNTSWTKTVLSRIDTAPSGVETLTRWPIADCFWGSCVEPAQPGEDRTQTLIRKYISASTTPSTEGCERKSIGLISPRTVLKPHPNPLQKSETSLKVDLTSGKSSRKMSVLYHKAQRHLTCCLFSD